MFAKASIKNGALRESGRSYWTSGGKKLEMDFVLEYDDRSMHILNAVSPAFTCALPFAAYVRQKIEPLVK